MLSDSITDPERIVTVIIGICEKIPNKHSGFVEKPANKSYQEFQS